MLSNIRIVLVETSHPGNIGAVARAMKNMCLQQLYLVSPVTYPSADATARASGADDLLAQARTCDSLEQALQGCRLVFGASARLRRISWPQVDVRECARKVLETSAESPVALVFGREHSGLTNEELECCHHLVHIPTNPAFSSLNVAAAVQVLAYEIYASFCETDAQPAASNSDKPPATAEEMEGYFRHLEQTLIDIDFIDPDNPRKLMRRLRRLYNRAQPDDTEVNILRGILTAVAKLKS